MASRLGDAGLGVVIRERGGMEDRWARWLLERRFGGDRAMQERLLDYLGPVRDRVLDNASLAPGEVLLDVGTGDGLIAFWGAATAGSRGSGGVQRRVRGVTRTLPRSG